jgi:hypothetical protein
MRVQDCFKDNVIPSKRYTHDCVDTGADWVIPAGVETAFECDCAGRNYMVDGQQLWLPEDNKIRDTIIDAHMTAKITLWVVGPKDAFVHLRTHIPHPTFGDILVDDIAQVIGKNNLLWPMTFHLDMYNSADGEPHLHGIVPMIYCASEITVKARAILVKVT